jgi:hypothetical protein
MGSIARTAVEVDGEDRGASREDDGGPDTKLSFHEDDGGDDIDVMKRRTPPVAR